MHQQTDWNGRVLNAALAEEPSLVLSFFSYGVLMRKRDGDAVQEFAVDPAQVAVALAARITFDTGLLADDTLLARQEGVQKTVVAFRRAQKTGLYLEGSDAPIRLPLPPLLMIRTTSENATPTYHLFAVIKRPVSLETPLFHAPLPNVYSSGGICWGSVPVASTEALKGSSLAEDWALLLGTPFNSHSVANKSRQFPADIRQMFLALEQRGARVYPKRDLIPTNKTLAQVLGDAS